MRQQGSNIPNSVSEQVRREIAGGGDEDGLGARDDVDDDDDEGEGEGDDNAQHERIDGHDRLESM